MTTIKAGKSASPFVVDLAPKEFDFVNLRRRYNLTQSDLAALLRVSKNYISQIETGRKIPGDSLIELAVRVEKELEAFLAEESRMLEESSDSGGANNPAIRYISQVWEAARGDKNLEGYILTRLKMAFPLDRPPFSSESEESEE